LKAVALNSGTFFPINDIINPPLIF